MLYNKNNVLVAGLWLIFVLLRHLLCHFILQWFSWLLIFGRMVLDLYQNVFVYNLLAFTTTGFIS